MGNCKTIEEKLFILKCMDLARPKKYSKPVMFDLEMFKLVSEWQHWALFGNDRA